MKKRSGETVCKRWRSRAIILAATVIAVLSIGHGGWAIAEKITTPVALKKIVGPNSCAECHGKEADAWKKSHHFSTFTDMPRSKAARKIANKMKIKRIKSQSLCLNCHFTAKSRRGKRQKPIAGISCESCHGPGKDWEKVHSEFSGKKKATESKAQAATRWKRSERAGMIRPGAIYTLAKNCYSCHVVPQENLVNVGGHPAGSAFELVAWSQGEVRHNLWYSNGKKNTEASAARKRILFIIGAIVELETALRAVGVATKSQTYAFKMAVRADNARKRIKAIAKRLPDVAPLQEIARLGYAAGLKLKNNAALSKTANGIAAQAAKLSASYDGRNLSAIDSMIPKPDKFKGEPFK